jgi:hypothetical protein
VSIWFVIFFIDIKIWIFKNKNKFQERFPRVCHLARQFCAIPLSDEIGNEWRRTTALNGAGHKDMDSQNASYGAELFSKDLLLLNGCSAEDGMDASLATLSHLLTVRMAVLEKNGCALPE